MKNKPKQIAAIICIVLLVLLDVATLIVSVLTGCSEPVSSPPSVFPFYCGFLSGCMGNIPRNKPLRIFFPRMKGKDEIS